MRLHRFDGDEQALGDLLVRVAASEQPQHLELEPLREPKTVEVSNTIGKVEVIQPKPNNVPVDVNCAVIIGETACPEETQNADKGSALLTINVKQRLGSVSGYYSE